MTMQKPQILGQAVFGTVRGLIVQGTGILSDAPVSIFEFDIGRQRNGLLHQLGPEGYVIFYRRIQDDHSTYATNLVGIVAPCRDSSGRPGFFGTCIATPLDPRGTGQSPFQDWGAVVPTLFDQIDATFALRDEKTMALNWPQVLKPTEIDRKVQWIRNDGRTLHVHKDQDIEDDDLLRKMQAIVYAHGGQYTTILTLSEPIQGSVGISSPDIETAVLTFNAAQKAPRVTPQEQTRSAGKSDRAHESDDYSLEAAIARIHALEIEVDDLTQEVRRLQNVRQTSASPHATEKRQHIPFLALGASEEEDELPRTWIWLAGGVLVLLLVTSLIAWMILSGSTVEVAPTTEDLSPAVGTETSQ